MAIKIGDKVLVEGAACEVLRVRGEGDNLTCIVKIPDTGAEQQVKVTEADLVEVDLEKNADDITVHTSVEELAQGPVARVRGEIGDFASGQKARTRATSCVARANFDLDDGARSRSDGEDLANGGLRLSADSRRLRSRGRSVIVLAIGGQGHDAVNHDGRSGFAGDQLDVA